MFSLTNINFPQIDTERGTGTIETVISQRLENELFWVSQVNK